MFPLGERCVNFGVPLTQAGYNSYVQIVQSPGYVTIMNEMARLTRVGSDILNYEFTVSDPTTWTAPWSAMIPLELKDELIYEYACHEGNEAIPDMLRGHRFEEREVAAKSRQK